MPTTPLQLSFSRIGLVARILDFIAICAGGWIAYHLRFLETESWTTMRPLEELIILSLAVFCSLFFGKFDPILPRGQPLTSAVSRVTLAWILAWGLLAVLLVLTKTAESVSRIWMVTWLGLTIVTLWIGRITSFFIVAQLHRAGYQNKTVLLYGDTAMVRSVSDRIKQAIGSGFTIVGAIEPGDGQDIEKVDSTLRPHEIWIYMRMSEQTELSALMQKLQHSVANIRLLPDLNMYQLLNRGLSITVGIPMVNISVSPIYGSRKIAKTLLDYGVASLALLLLSPLMLLIALLIKLSSKGPVLFRQKRHGWNGEEIWVHKFRTMVVHQELQGSVTQAMRNDGRVTALGKILRKTSLDELPQFFDVLAGRMSVVGPRPHALQHNQVYSELIPRYVLRHKVKPGITGWAQVCGYRGETDTVDKMEGRLRHDIYYLEHWSLWMDLKIIALTPLAVFLNKNVY